LRLRQANIEYSSTFSSQKIRLRFASKTTSQLNLKSRVCESSQKSFSLPFFKLSILSAEFLLVMTWNTHTQHIPIQFFLMKCTRSLHNVHVQVSWLFLRFWKKKFFWAFFCVDAFMKCRFLRERRMEFKFCPGMAYLSSASWTLKKPDFILVETKTSFCEYDG
jgi:hypothetical protein